MNKNISIGKLAYTNMDWEQTANGICILMWPQNTLHLFNDIKFPADKKIILKNYHFDTSAIFSCILETIYMEDHKYVWNDPQTEDATWS